MTRLFAAGWEADDVVLEMEAPEYLDLDEIDFSDDSVVSVIQNPFRKRFFVTFFFFFFFNRLCEH